jgi:hypothetical protein
MSENPLEAAKSKASSLLGASKPKIISNTSDTYNPVPEYWYKSLPYGFKAKIDGKFKIFYLPINPQNLTITTHYATNVISTLHGTVEEHSEQRYFDITIQGTTGFSPRYVEDRSQQVTKSYSGRQNYSAFSLASLAGGFFSKTLGKVDNALNQAGDIKNIWGDKPGNGFEAGVFNDNSGYAAFHNFYKFLLDYKKSAAKGKQKPKPASPLASKNESLLYFLNYKDNNKYSCAVQTFTLERSAENPMLYNYVIRLRAYNLTGITKDEEDPASLKDRVAELGLDGKPSLFSKLKNTANKAKSLANSAVGAYSTLGA